MLTINNARRRVFAIFAVTALILSGIFTHATPAVAADNSSSYEDDNVKIELSLISGDPKTAGSTVEYRVAMTNKTGSVRSFESVTTNLNNGEGCKWQSMPAGTPQYCYLAGNAKKLTHTVTEAEAANGGFVPVIAFQMYSQAGYKGSIAPAGAINTTPQVKQANSTITVSNPKENGEPWNVGDQIKFTITLKNDSSYARSYQSHASNLTNWEYCKWGSISPGETKTDCTGAYHVVTEADLEAGSFTPQITWKGFTGTGYPAGQEAIFAPNYGPTQLVAKHAIELVTFEVDPASTKDVYQAGDIVSFNVQLRNVFEEDITVTKQKGNVAFNDEPACSVIKAGTVVDCVATYTLTDVDLATGYIQPSFTLKGSPAGLVNGYIDYIPVSATDYPEATEFTPFNADPTQEAQADLNVTYVAQNDSEANVRIPAITVASNGDLLASFDRRPKAGMSSGGDSPNENWIMQRRSTDNGATWGPVTVVAKGQIGSHGYSDPSYVVDYTTGTIFNFHVFSRDAGFLAGRYTLDADGNIDQSPRDTVNLGLSVSTDNGHTWTERVITEALDGHVPGVRACFATSGAGTQKMHEPHKGRLLQQLACRTDAGDLVALTMFSDDHGETWQTGNLAKYLAADTGLKGKLVFDENKVVELSNGDLLLNSRSSGGVGQGKRVIAISRDGGVNWEDYRVATEMIDPVNNAQVIRAFPTATPGSLRSKVLLFSNTNHASNRTNGTLWASFDDGETWPVKKVFRSAGTGYTTMAVQNDGTIGILMEPDSGGWSGIGYVNVNLRWLEEDLRTELKAKSGESVTVTAGSEFEPIVVGNLFDHNDPVLADFYTVTGLPDGLTFDPETQTISGVVAGDLQRTTNYDVTVKLVEEDDGTGWPREATASFVVKVQPDGGRTWYVAADGDDTNDGLSPDQPFKTLAPVNELELRAGDAIYLHRGDVFNDQFMHLTGAGSATEPIIVSAYGDETKPLPVINTNGKGVWHQDFHTALDNSRHKNKGDVSSSILLKDVEYIEVSNIEITNARTGDETYAYNDINAMNRTGVAVIAENIGTVNHVVLENLYIHDVQGNVYDKHMANGGIYFIAHKPLDETATGVARFDDVQVLNNRVERVNRWGIGVGYTAYSGKFGSANIADATMEQYGQTNVVIRGNYVKEAGGDAITAFYALRPLVEYNVSDSTSTQINFTDYSATDFGRVAAAIWPWKTKDAVFQYNEVYNSLNGATGNGDAMAWDADWSDGTLYQYNYSHGNTGGTYMICGVQATNSTFRFNISQNDLMGVIDIPDRVPNGHIYNNTFYVAKDVPVLRDGHTQNGNVRIENNIFYYAGDTARQENWTKGSGNRVWDSNLYYNYANYPADANAVKVAAGTEVLVDPGSGPTTPLANFATNFNDSWKFNAAGSVDAGTSDVDTSAFAGYQLPDDSPAIDAGKAITDQNGKALDTDFFGAPVAGKADIGAAQSSKPGLVATIYHVDDAGLNVPSTPKNETTVAEVLAGVEVAPDATVEVVDAAGTVVDPATAVADGMKLKITADGKTATTPVTVVNSYDWAENYKNAVQGNVWFAQHQATAGAEWTNITTYDPKWPNWQVDLYYGPGVNGNLALPEDRSTIHGLLSDSPANAEDSTAMAFRAPKTGAVTFEIRGDEPYLRQAENTGGTVTLSLVKNDEVIQSVTLSESMTQSAEWENYLADNPLFVEKGDVLRVVAHSEGKPTKPSLFITPKITYIDRVEVVPVAPLLQASVEVVCGVEAEVVVPELVEGVIEYTQAREGDVVTVTAVLAEGYVLAEGATDTWELTIPAVVPCPVEVTPEAPTVTDVDVIGGDTITIPSVEGVEYLIDSVVVAGTYEVPAGRTEVVVNARALDGYVLAEGATSEWTLTVTEPAAPEEPEPVVVTPTAPTVDDDADTYTIPEIEGVVYTVNGEPVTGTVSVGDEDTTIVVTAAPASDEYVLVEGAETEFSLTFTKAEVIDPVDPVDPVDPEESTELSLVISDQTVVAGDVLKLKASGFEPGESVTFEIHSDVVTLAPVTVSTEGIATAQWTVPADFEIGAHEAWAIGAVSGTAKASFTVLAVQVPSDEPTDEPMDEPTDEPTVDPADESTNDEPGASDDVATPQTPTAVDDQQSGDKLAKTGPEVTGALALMALLIATGAVAIRRRYA